MQPVFKLYSSGVGFLAEDGLGASPRTGVEITQYNKGDGATPLALLTFPVDLNESVELLPPIFQLLLARRAVGGRGP